MGLWRPPGVGQAQPGVLVASFLVLFCACVVDVCKGLAGVHDDEGRRADPCVGEVRAKTGGEDGEDGVIGGVHLGG